DGNTENEYKSCTGYYVKKWISKYNNYDNATKTMTYHKFAYPYIRIAEPYMDYVEAYVQYYGKIDGKALEYINVVRNRAGLPDFETSWALVGGLPTGKQLLKAVLQERLSEFIFEGRWYHDLRRYKYVQNILMEKSRSWNLAGTTAETFYHITEGYETDTRTFTAPKNYWLPVPQEQITINPNLVQNPGY
ncbi:MAG: RagB/SusD family nutrient uptake outer membrane protein, partial [Candidatus Cryptobacteroides sp.]